MLSFFIFFIQICINMAFCANILLKNRSCLGFNPYPPERGATPWNSWWGVGCRPLENHTRFQTKMGRVCTLFQTKTAQKTQPFGAAHPYMAYIREYPPPPATITSPMPLRCVARQETAPGQFVSPHYKWVPGKYRRGNHAMDCFPI